jgi:hypothetical protein
LNQRFKTRGVSGQHGGDQLRFGLFHRAQSARGISAAKAKSRLAGFKAA